MSQLETTQSLVQSVDRALEILDFLIETPGSASLSRICEGVSLNVSTGHRLLGTLIAHGYVRQDPLTKEYMVGPQSLRLAQTALSNFDIRDRAMEPLRDLAASARELANLAALNGDHAIYIAQVPAGERTIQMFTQLGALGPLYCSGVGKAMIAFMPETLVDRLVGNRILAAYTVNTITNILKLKQELQRVRECGYAVDDEEREEGVRCVAAPIFQSNGEVVAAISISGPSGRFPYSRLDELGNLVKQAAWRVSYNLGYRAE
jgi:DNA-binding IclR family transcriptional regulator